MSSSAVFTLKVVPHAGPEPCGCAHGGRCVPPSVATWAPIGSLAHVLRARQTLTEPEVRYYLRGLVSGLRYLHQRRIVHRDLKLSNFFLNKNMEVKIGDLGLAAKVGPGGRCHRVLCGTPNFLAPEVVSRNGHSRQSDIWALGCIMYTVLTGAPPFTASPLSELYQNIREGHYPEPVHLSPSARRLIARLLAPNPAERPSLDHLLQDDFFTQGFTPDRLPAHSCHSPPIFTAPPPLGRIFRKVGQLLLTQCRPPCPFTPKEASGPGEDGPNPDSMEWGGESSMTAKGVPCLEAPVHLIAQGTLQSDLAGEQIRSSPGLQVGSEELQVRGDKTAACQGLSHGPGLTCPTRPVGMRLGVEYELFL
ncbi:Inactive serine/threonine-protein kinase plk5 [Saguinus oedipus]|uniref:Inactive serine/threonine-protein kinase plk5 n=1 Tax=Saguinus oedipus TaxID=9490 RepID=A0ABQ9TQ20_SAGOE|nr:Inactive serine/threonine-protein kinase plk5 [Saguinus oedipus]